MNQLKYLSIILFSTGVTIMSTSYSHAATDSFGRLFTTPEERRNLQAVRYAEAEVEEVVEINLDEMDEVDVEETEARDLEGITLNGIVYRKGSRSTVWLNDSNSYEGSLSSEYFRINTSAINSQEVSVSVPEADLMFDLKVGQTYEPNNESLLDIVEDGDAITISKD